MLRITPGGSQPSSVQTYPRAHSTFPSLLHIQYSLKHLSLSPSALAFHFKLSEEEVLSYFSEGGELNYKNENKETFFVIYSSDNDTYKFYDSHKIVFLTLSDAETSTFMVFKADCLNSLESRNSFNEAIVWTGLNRGSYFNPHFLS